MTVVTIKDPSSGSCASIAVHRGFNCFAFQAQVAGRRIDVLDSDPAFAEGAGRPSGNGIPVLFPYPNRIRGGRYQHAGQEVVISPDLAGYDRTGNAIHGFCLDRPWRVIDQTEDSLTGEFQLSRDAADRRSLWPSDCLIRIKYRVRGASLLAEIEIVNPDSVPMPWGFGTHSYFKLPLTTESKPEECLLFAPVKDHWEIDQCLPSGRKLPLPADVTLPEGQCFGARVFDDGFGLLNANVIQCSILDQRGGVEVVQSHPDHYPELVVYTPPQRAAICFEPYTCMTDAINLANQGIAAGWQTLSPGESFKSWIDITARVV